MERYRHELKYLISFPEYEALRLSMSRYFSLDKNAVDGEYMIRSLYFDDIYGSAYEDKNAGIYHRKKYRIRIYNYSDSHIKLERKKKQGNYIYKESADLSRDEFYRILEGDYEFLLHSEKKLCQELYVECICNVLRPRVIVDYERVPFILDSGTVRITFDKNVRAAVGGFDIFDRNLTQLPAIDRDKLIMEVKYTEFLPRIVRSLVPPQSSELTAASKYVLCCDKTAYLHGQDYYVDERYIL
jgi:hypothetical protein